MQIKLTKDSLFVSNIHMSAFTHFYKNIGEQKDFPPMLFILFYFL